MTENTTEAGSLPQDESVKPDSQTDETTDVNESSSPQEDAQKESESSPEKDVAEAISEALKPETEAPAEKAAETSEPDPAVKPEVKDEKPLTAEELYEEPEGLKPKGQDRFRSLVEDNKATKTQLGEATSALQEIRKTVETSGMSPEEFGTMIEYGRLVHSTDPADLKVAYKLARDESRKLALELGIQEDGVDLLADFPDLKEQRESLEITEESALELAKLRRRESELTAEKTQLLHNQEQTTQLEQVKTDSLNEVKSFMSNKKQTDIDYAHKESVLMSKVDDIRNQFAPKDWPKVIAQLYDTIGAGASDARDTRKKNAQQPISSSNSTTSGESHSSALDAIKAVLG